MAQVLGATLPPIINQEKFDEVVQTAQQKAREKYNYALSYDDARKMMTGQPVKTKLRIPTLAALGQEFKQKVEASGLTGLWEGKPTLAAQKQQGELTGLTTSPELTADVLGVNVSGIYDPKTRKITNGQAFGQAMQDIVTQGKANGIDITAWEAERLAKGESIPNKMIPTVGGRGVKVAEGELSLSTKIKTGELALAGQDYQLRVRAMQLEELVREGTLTIAQADQLLRTEIQRGELNLSKGRLELETAIAADHRATSLSDRDIRKRAQQLAEDVERGNLTIAKARLKLDEEIEQKKLGIEQGEFELRKDALRGFTLPDGTEVHGTLYMEWLLRNKELGDRAAQRDFDVLMQEGGNFVDSSGKVTSIVGTRQIQENKEILANTQKYGGYLGVRNEDGSYSMVKVTGDQEHDDDQTALDRQLMRDGWTEIEKSKALQRNYELGTRYGMYVPDPNVTEGRRWVGGSLYEGQKADTQAQQWGLDRLTRQAVLSDHSEYLKYMHSKLLLAYGAATDAKKGEVEQAWASAEAVLTREHETIMQDTRLTAAEKIAKVEQNQADHAMWVDLVSRVANPLVQVGLWKLFNSKGRKGLQQLARAGTGIPADAGLTPEEIALVGDYIASPDGAWVSPGVAPGATGGTAGGAGGLGAALGTAGLYA